MNPIPNLDPEPTRNPLLKSQDSDSQLSSLSVVIPVYNERETVLELVDRVRAVPFVKEIIVVDDGSTDGTAEILESLNADSHLQILHHADNRGKGAAVKTGFLKTTGDIVLIQDADLEYDPKDYELLLQPIVNGDVDVVYGSRFLSSRSRSSLTFWQGLANRSLTLLSNALTGLRLTDMETGYKVFRQKVVRQLAPGLKQQRFGIEPELTAKVARGGYRLQEVAINYKARNREQGKKIGWLDGLKALWCILRYSRWD